MELAISDRDAVTIGLNSSAKERLVSFVHRHLGLASVAFVTVEEHPPCIKLETHAGVVRVNLTMTERVD